MVEVTEIETAVKLISQRKIAPVYFLMGNDQFLQQEFVRTLSEAIFADKPPDKTILLPDEMSSKEILKTITSIDLFNTLKLFILRNPASISGSYRDELFEYVQNPLENHFLVIISDEWRSRTAFSKSIIKILKPISCSTPFESAMKKWAKSFLNDQGIKKVEDGFIESLVLIAGDSLSHLKNEIDKICLLLEKDTSLTKKDLVALGNWKREYRQFELFMALGEKNLPLSLKLGQRLISKDLTMLSLLYPLTEFYRELFFLKCQIGTKSRYGGYTGLSSGVKNNLSRYAKNYSLSEIKLALRKLWQIDQQLKLSQIDDEAAITEFVFSALGNE